MHQCTSGQRGPYCAVCAEGFHGGSDGRLCEECEGSKELTWVPIPVVLLLLAMWLLWIFEHELWEARSHVLKHRSIYRRRPFFAPFIWCFMMCFMKFRWCFMKLRWCFMTIRSCFMTIRSCFKEFRKVDPAARNLEVKIRSLISLYQLLNGVVIVFEIPYALAQL